MSFLILKVSLSIIQQKYKSFRHFIYDFHEHVTLDTHIDRDTHNQKNAYKHARTRVHAHTLVT